MFEYLKKDPLSNRWSAVLPFVYLVGILVADHLESTSIITPPLAMIGLLCLALILSTPWMLAWVLVYSIVIVGILKTPFVLIFSTDSQPLQQDLLINLRIIAFFLVGLFCIAFTILLSSFRKSLGELRGLLAIIPDPIVASDSRGKILFCNTRMLEKTGLKRNELVGQGFFGFFAPKEIEGQTIASYLNRFEASQTEDPFPLRIHDVGYEGETLKLQSGYQEIMITIFKEKSPPNSFHH